MFICNDCVVVSRRLLDERFPPPPPPAQPFPSPPGRKLTDAERWEGYGQSGTDGGAALAKAFGVELMGPGLLQASPEILALVPEAVAWHHRVFPLARTDTTIKIAMMDPSDGRAIAAVMKATGLNVEVTLALDLPLRKALALHYPRRATPSGQARPCSFCGKPPAEVMMLIPGPAAETMICDECIELCEDILAEEFEKSGG